MILSRAKPAIQKPDEVNSGGSSGSASSKKQLPKLDEFLTKRDYMGALSLLEFQRNSGQGNDQTDLWIGYCAFHVGDYKRALMEYEALNNKSANNKEVNICLACTYFYLGMYQEAEKAAEKADKGQLRWASQFFKFAFGNLCANIKSYFLMLGRVSDFTWLTSLVTKRNS